MLKNIEPDYYLRFVEKKDGKTEVHNVFCPATIGHEGTVKPLILNGAISKIHCRVTHDLIAKTYRIEDGSEAKPSTNHLYYSDGGEVKQVDSIDISKLGQIVYLMRTMKDGTEGYLELYDPYKSTSYECPTQDLDDGLVRKVHQELQLGFEKINSDGAKRDEKLVQLETAMIAVQQGGNLLIEISKHWKQLIIGTIVGGFILVNIGAFVFAWLYHERFFDRILPAKTEVNKSGN